MLKSAYSYVTFTCLSPLQQHLQVRPQTKGHQLYNQHLPASEKRSKNLVEKKRSIKVL